MTEYIIDIPHECFSICDGVIHDRYYPDERHDPMPIQEVVRCRDCEHYRESDATCHSWQWHNWDAPTEVDADGFCAWGSRKDSGKS